MTKKPLSDIFNNKIMRSLVIIIVILFIIIAIILGVTYKYIYLNEQQHAKKSIDYFFNSTSNLVTKVVQEYNSQLEDDLLNFYRDYQPKRVEEYIDSEMKEIKDRLYQIDKFDKVEIKKVNYYLINSQGEIFSTDYKVDQGLDLSEQQSLWKQLKSLESGEVLLKSFENETLRSQMRLYAYVKLPDNNYFELGILFNDFPKVLLQQMRKISQNPNLRLKLFTSDFKPLFNNDLELSSQDRQLLQQSVDQNKLIVKEKSLFSESYYQTLTSKYGNLYAVLDFDHSSLRVILNFVIILLFSILIIIYLTYRKLEDELEQVLTPIEALAEDMNQFYQTQSTNLNQAETGFLEIDHIIYNYINMAEEISASYEQLEAYSEELETKNNQLASSKNKLRKIIDLSPNFIFINDKQGDYLLVNETYAQFFGYTAGDFEDVSIYELLGHLDEEQIEKFLNYDRKVINNQEKEIIEEHIPNKNGEEIILETIKIPFEEDNKMYCLTIARDITQQRRSQNRIKDQKEELEASYQQLEAYNSEILDLNKNLEEAYQKQDELIKKLEKVISLTSDLTHDSLTDKREFLSQLLHSAFEIIEEVDYGSVYLFGEEEIEFIDVIGHDLELLQSINIKNEVFHSNPEEPEVIDHILNDTKLSLTGENKELFIKASKDIKKSVVFSLIIDGERKAGFSLDIAADNQDDFSKQSLEIIDAFNSLAFSFYTLQNYASMQNKFQQEIVSSLINLLEVHDQYTKGHSENVSRLGTKVAFELGLSIEEINDTYWAGLLHDIGKTVVPKNILNKPGKLTDLEYQKIKQHPFWGYKALKDSEQLKKIAEYIYFHHERPDGKGYPQGATAEEIPLISKILTVVDAWDAMRSTRAYRSPLSKEKALKELIENKGTQFSAKVVEAFVAIIEKDYQFNK